MKRKDSGNAEMIKKILIVDDSPVARKMLMSFMPRDAGYELYEARDGKEGLEKYMDIGPDVTFMDLTMPVMSGHESLERIMKYDRDAMIIVVTADVQIKSIKKSIDLGAYMVLQKPLKREEIHSALLRVGDELLKAG